MEKDKLNPSELKKKIYQENPEPRKNLEKGNFHIDYFHGQTLLYVPKDIANTIGKKNTYCFS